MPYDYSMLFEDKEHNITWRDIYDDDLQLPDNLTNILKRTVFLPQDFYDVVTAYLLLPSALCRIVPYLFLYGQSGSGKSTLAKLASYLHGVGINSSSDTFAGIRNSLNKRRYTQLEVPSGDPKYPSFYKEVEKNTCMVWDDIDSSVFTNNPDLYRLFKFGYDRSTDRITLSSSETGVNLEFRCFCPKVFSSVSPLHLDDRFKELKRRMIVIPCRRVEELSEKRLTELGVTKNNWQFKLLDVSAYDWTGFDKTFDSFWNMDMGAMFLSTRKLLSSHNLGFNSQQSAISFDLLTTGLTVGIWDEIDEGIERLQIYWDWFREETEASGGLSQLLKQLMAEEERNLAVIKQPLELYVSQIRGQIEMWVAQGWLFERPKSSEVKALLLDLGMRQQQGKWIKG
jgi:energy-coupling factor transporter ATP-binding protein EcfA2